VYLNAPVSRLAAVIDLGPAVIDAPEQIAAVAERARAVNGVSVLEYVRDLERAFAIPILHVTEYPGLSAEQLRGELGAFHPPQGYVRLNQHRRLLTVCEKIAAETPVREMPVENIAAAPERFFCASEQVAVVPIPSLTSHEAFDSGVVLGAAAAARLLDHGRQAYAAARRVETVEAVTALDVLRERSARI
jgi:hypothetical protein